MTSGRRFITSGRGQWLLRDTNANHVKFAHLFYIEDTGVYNIYTSTAHYPSNHFDASLPKISIHLCVQDRVDNTVNKVQPEEDREE